MKRLIGVIVSAIILAILWYSVDFRAMLRAFALADPFWLTAGLAAVIPITLATAWRFTLLTGADLGLSGATRLILSASTLNAFLPSKMGDIAKALALSNRYGHPRGKALAIVVMEKLMDMASLLVWGLAAILWVAGGDIALLLGALAVAGLLALILLLLAPYPLATSTMAWLGGHLPGKAGQKARDFSSLWAEATQWFWADRKRAISLWALSIGLWAAHLAQFWLFARALNAAMPLIDNMAFATLSILVGLLPFTMAGIGTRDAAIVYFYRGWLSPAEGAALGILATSRYLIPAIAGLPFMQDYWRKGKAAA